jgi:hypothetical protein
MQRYAPEPMRVAQLHETIGRYAQVAVRERAAEGFARGMATLLETIGHQPRRPLDELRFDRFTGLARVREVLTGVGGIAGARVAVVDGGKNRWAVERGLREHGARIVTAERDAEWLAVGTLSPGPLWDAWERRAARGEPLLPPWIGDVDAVRPELVGATRGA